MMDTPYRHHRPSRHSEDGAVVVVVALFFAFAVLGIAALTIDLGGLWTEQRALVIDTDAMALAGAQTLAEFEECDETDSAIQNAVRATVMEYADLNDVAVDLMDEEIGITCAPTGRGGVVKVGASETPPGYFSGEELSVRQTTSAEYVLESIFRQESETTRPAETNLAFCENLLPMGDSGEEVDGGGETHYLPYNYKGLRDDLDKYLDPDTNNPPDLKWYEDYRRALVGEDWEPEFCNVLDAAGFNGSPTLPGGWGWLLPDSLAGGTGPSGDKCDVTDLIPLLGEDTGVVDGAAGNTCMQNWVAEDLEEGEHFVFPIFDQASGNGGGEFRVTGYGRAELVGCSGSGTNQVLPFDRNCQGNPRWIEMKLLSINKSDETSREATEFELFRDRGLRICAVDDSECTLD